MPKSIWKGDISFGLVSISVSLVSTEEHKDLHFHLLNAKTHARVRYQRIDENSGKVVPWEHIIKGYEYEKGNYIEVDEEAFERASADVFKTLDIEEFVDLKEIDTLYYSQAYYLVPEGKNKKAYVLLREALQKTNKVGVAKIILRTKEHLSLIMPHEHSLVLYLLHFKDQIRPEDAINAPKNPVNTYKISDKEIKMAIDLIADMTATWQPEKYHNHYQETLEKWLDQQVSKQAKPRKKSSKNLKNNEAVVDFVALLKDSMRKKNIASKKTKRAS